MSSANTKKPVKKENGMKKSKQGLSLVSNDFFSGGIEIDTNTMYPMLVMATMSSGKSTLINALLGQQILPSKNEACTAKMYSILDDDQNTVSRLYITDVNGKTTVKETNIADELAEANNDPNVANIFIRGQVKGVLNTDKALLIVDTPGPNNSRDLSHEKIMKEILGKINGGLILYVINATQMGINDDKYLLDLLKRYLVKHKKSEVLFVLNKIDQIDVERESIDQLVLSVRDYLQTNGFERPNIIPVSALAASIFKKVLNKEMLTRNEYRSFAVYYELYMPRDFNMKSYAITDDFPNQFEEIELKGEKYRVGDLVRAIENTGIKVLEDNIQKAQILSSVKLKHTIRIK